MEIQFDENSNLNISNNPTFSMLSEKMINNWENILSSNNREITNIISETFDFNIQNYSSIYEKIITNDCNRTRVSERYNFTNFEHILKNLLIFYCNYNNIYYKQGLNEILATFLLIAVKIKTLTIQRIFNIFSYFIDNFLCKYYFDKNLIAFQSSTKLLNLLLKYNEPELYNLFEKNFVTPEMYATNWLLTLFCNKNDLEIVYHMWDYLINLNDKIFIYFLIVAFLKFYRNKFLPAEYSTIPLLFSQLKIQNYNEFKKIIVLAEEIKNETPFSFRILIKKLEIFEKNSENLEKKFNEFDIENLIALPILPCEVASFIYKNKINCMDNKCKNYLINKNNFFDEKEECYNCKNKIKKENKFIIIDLRLNNQNSQSLKNNIIEVFSNNSKLKNILKEEKIINNEGYFFCNSSFEYISLIQNNKLNENNINKFPNFLKKYKNNCYNLIFFTNDSKYYSYFEKEIYIEQNNPESKKKFILLLNNEHKTEKIIDEKKLKLFCEKNENNKLIFNEYFNIRNIINILVENNFHNISFIYGGFKAMHEICMKYGLKLINHNDNKCIFCKELKNQNEKINLLSKLLQNNINNNINNNNNFKLESIEEINVNKMNEYLNDKQNKIYHCLIINFNDNLFNDKVILVMQKDLFKIFKMNVKNEGIFFDILLNVYYDNIVEINKNKNIFNITYNINYINNTIQIDIFTDQDADSFNNDIIQKFKETQI